MIFSQALKLQNFIGRQAAFCRRDLNPYEIESSRFTPADI